MKNKEKKSKKLQRIPHRVIGKVKREHIDKIAELPQVDPEPVQAANDAELNEEEHILVAVPKSVWQRFVDWFE